MTETKRLAPTTSLLTKIAILVVLAGLIFSWQNISYASHLPVKLSPVEEVNPEPADKSTKMEKSASLEAKQVTQSKTTKKKKSSFDEILSLFWNDSRKPASFHFIDIIEILE